MTADRFIVSDSFIWFLAIVLSLSAHFIFLLQRQTHHAAPSNVIQETITQVRFSTLAPPPVNVSEPEVETPKPEPVIPPEPVVIKTQEPEPPVKPELKPKPIPKPKPVPKIEKPKKPVSKPKPPVKKVPVKPKTIVKEKRPEVKRQASAQKVQSDKIEKVKASPVIAKADARLLEQTRISYHALLMRHIEVHKNYPRVARKRKIQGDILVTFVLLADGRIKNLKITGKKSILKKATHLAIEHALPMPAPPKDLSLPMEVKFTMNYHLR